MNRLQTAALYSALTVIPTGLRRLIQLIFQLRLFAPTRTHASLMSLVPVAGAMCALVAQVGCKPATDQVKKPLANNQATVNKPTVPLRVWFVSDESAQPLLQRQWQSTYDRSLELRMLTAQGLADQSRCDCDVVVYPALMLGEMIARDWLVELPSALQPRSQSQAQSDIASLPDRTASIARTDSIEPQPAAWLEQARYGRRNWALSLNVATPVVLANFSLPENVAPRAEVAVTPADSEAYWQAIVDALAAQTESQNAKENQAGGAQELAVDREALCDRFLVISTSLSNRDPRFGLLFNPETLQPRLTDESFVAAAKMLLQLQHAGASLAALAGNHAAAWESLNRPHPNVTIGFPPPASAEVDKITTIEVRQPPTNPARAGARTSSGWNSGRGLVVSITNQCRQTGPSLEFARWLCSESTRSAFTKRIEGFASETAYAPGSSAWQAQRMVQRLGQQAGLPGEPRLPSSLRYRLALGEQLEHLLRGEKTAAEALEAAAVNWQEINASSDSTVRRKAYVESLGL